MGQVQVSELEVDGKGTVVRAAYFEGSPWPGVDFVGRPLEEVLTFEGSIKAYRGVGHFNDRTECEYHRTEVGDFCKFNLRANVAVSAPMNRLGAFATVNRAVQLVEHIQRLTYGFGVAVYSPVGHIQGSLPYQMRSHKLAVALLGALRDPMAMVSLLESAVAFAVPSSRIDRLEKAAQAAMQEIDRTGGGADGWTCEVVCATPPYSAMQVIELCYSQALLAGRNRAVEPPRAA